MLGLLGRLSKKIRDGDDEKAHIILVRNLN
jgi:hypothetical protein